MPRSAPPNGFLGRERLYEKGDIVFYTAMPYWKADRGMWHDVEGIQGIVQGVERASFYYSYASEDYHPYKYPVLFEGHDRPLTPAPENLQPISVAQTSWEL